MKYSVNENGYYEFLLLQSKMVHLLTFVVTRLYCNYSIELPSLYQQCFNIHGSKYIYEDAYKLGPFTHTCGPDTRGPMCKRSFMTLHIHLDLHCSLWPTMAWY